MSHVQDIWGFDELTVEKEKEIDRVAEEASKRALAQIEEISNEYIKLKRFYDYMSDEIKKPADSNETWYFNQRYKAALWYANHGEKNPMLEVITCKPASRDFGCVEINDDGITRLVE